MFAKLSVAICFVGSAVFFVYYVASKENPGPGVISVLCIVQVQKGFLRGDMIHPAMTSVFLIRVLDVDKLGCQV